MKIEIKISDKKARDWNYFLGNRYGKRKTLKNKCNLAIMEIISVQARKEVDNFKVEEK